MGPPFSIPFFRECSVFLADLSWSQHFLMLFPSSPVWDLPFAPSLLHFLHFTGSLQRDVGAATHPSVVWV